MRKRKSGELPLPVIPRKGPRGRHRQIFMHTTYLLFIP